MVGEWLVNSFRVNGCWMGRPLFFPNPKKWKGVEVLRDLGDLGDLGPPLESPSNLLGVIFLLSSPEHHSYHHRNDHYNHHQHIYQHHHHKNHTNIMGPNMVRLCDYYPISIPNIIQWYPHISQSVSILCLWLCNGNCFFFYLLGLIWDNDG